MNGKLDAFSDYPNKCIQIFSIFPYTADRITDNRIKRLVE